MDAGTGGVDTKSVGLLRQTQGRGQSTVVQQCGRGIFLSIRSLAGPEEFHKRERNGAPR